MSSPELVVEVRPPAPSGELGDARDTHAHESGSEAPDSDRELLLYALKRSDGALAKSVKELATAITAHNTDAAKRHGELLTAVQAAVGQAHVSARPSWEVRLGALALFALLFWLVAMVAQKNNIDAGKAAEDANKAFSPVSASANTKPGGATEAGSLASTVGPPTDAPSRLDLAGDAPRAPGGPRPAAPTPPAVLAGPFGPSPDPLEPLAP